MYDYSRQIRWSALKAGIVVSGALFVVFLAALFAGNIGELVSRKGTIYAAFDDVKGLRKGAPVWFSGIEIGSVKAITFAPGGMVRAALSVDRRAFSHINKDATAAIITLGLLGDKYVEIGPGKSAETLRPGDTIKGVTRPDVQDIVKTSEMSVKKVNDFIEKLAELLSGIERGEGTVSRFITDPALYNSTLEASESLADFTRRLAASEGTVKMLIANKTLYDNLDASSAKLSAILDRINRGEGVMGKLSTDEELSSELKTTLAELKLLIKDMRENPKKYFRFSLF